MYIVTSWCLLPSAQEFPLYNMPLRPIFMAPAPSVHKHCSLLHLCTAESLQRQRLGNVTMSSSGRCSLFAILRQGCRCI